MTRGDGLMEAGNAFVAEVKRQDIETFELGIYPVAYPVRIVKKLKRWMAARREINSRMLGKMEASGMSENADKLLKVGEVATLLSVSKRTVYYLIDMRELRAVRLCYAWRVRRSWVEDYLLKKEAEGKF